MVESVTSVTIVVSLAVLGAVLGSFMMAQVWRVRARQLVLDQAAGEAVDEEELKRLLPLTERTARQDRSQCLSCRHQLAWYDLIPIISWLSLGGRCRYCKQPIGSSELFMEIGLAALFVASYFLWPVPVLASGVQAVLFGLWLAGLTLLAGLFVYDKRWYLLPDVFDYPFIVAGLLYAAVAILMGLAGLWSVVAAVALLGGLYGLLYLVSRGAWVGFGDVKLGLGLGLFLLDWRLALIALFLANLVGTLIVLPGLIRGTLARESKIPFGPFLIIGFLLAWLLTPLVPSLFSFFFI